MKIGLCSAQGLEQKRTKTQSIGPSIRFGTAHESASDFCFEGEGRPPHPDRYERRFVPPRTFFQNKIGGRHLYVRCKDRTIRLAVDLCIGKSPMPQPGRGLRIEHHRPENESKRPLYELPRSLYPHGICEFSVRNRCVTASWLERYPRQFLSRPRFARVGTDTDDQDSQSECTEEQGESARSRRIRKSKA